MSESGPSIPRQFTYDPRWQLIAYLLAISALVLVVPRVLEVSYGSAFASLSAVLATVALLLTVRCYIFRRQLLLEPEELILPTGFMQVNTVRIPYSSIERVWVNYAGWAAILAISTAHGRFNIIGALLPEKGSFVALQNFFASKITPASTP